MKKDVIFESYTLYQQLPHEHRPQYPQISIFIMLKSWGGQGQKEQKHHEVWSSLNMQTKYVELNECNTQNHANHLPWYQGLLLCSLPSIENGYSQLGPQTSIGVIVTNKRKEMYWYNNNA